jgi:uncharacterized protein YuzE
MRREGRKAEYDPEADAIYVWLSDRPLARTLTLDDSRNVDLAEDGTAVGVELLGVSGGIDLSDIPQRPTVERLISQLGLNLNLVA